MAHPAWTDEFLDGMRLIGDEPADQLVKELFAEQQVGAVNLMMRKLVENEGIPPGSIPDSLREFLQSSAVLPQWTGMEKVRLAENLFWLHGPAIVLLLFCYSLPFCYAARKEVQALALTGRLYTDVNRRVTETAQMVIDVMAPGGLTGSGAGVRTAQKVRLMHAGVRVQILASKRWSQEFGCPLNQEDLAGTLMSFSVIVLDGLRQLNISVSELEAEAYLHCWKVIGHILGLREELMPVDLADATAFTKAFRVRQFEECAEGQLMTKALLDMMAHILPGNIFDLIPQALTYHFTGEKMANLLGVKPVPFDSLLFLPLQLSNVIADDFLSNSGWMQELVELVSMHLLESLQLVARGGKRASFSIPTKLWRGWKRRPARRINLYLAVKIAMSALCNWLRHRPV
jgi:hypothetical protein